MKATQWIASLIMVLVTSIASANQYQYEGVFAQSGDSQLFQGLNLQGVNKVTLQASDQFDGPDLRLDQLTIQFSNAAPLLARDFKLVDGHRYLALVEDAWVFNRLLVEIDANSLNQHNQLMVRVMVVDVSSRLSDLRQAFGPELVHVNAMLRDVTPKVLADSASLVVEGKNLTLQLFDRLGSHDPLSMEPPVPGFEQGFSLTANWQGKGVKTFFLPAPAGPDNFRDFTAVALLIESIEAPHGTDHFVRIKFKDPTGFTQESQPVFLNQAIMQLYPQL
ncbi:hypothetical protein R50072_10800 [Simiduia litorea]|uniref:hypothetical protein n=1 Tax=Simiduia litorea TaxID=1435348 RepID=UPI0036F44E44